MKKDIFQDMPEPPLVLWRDVQKIEADKNFISDAVRLFGALRDAIRDYPIPELIDLTGDFETGLANIRDVIPSNLFNRKFAVGVTHNATTGQLRATLGESVKIDFERQQKEKMFAQTKGEISPGVCLTLEGVMRYLAVKDSVPLLAAAHNSRYFVEKDFPDSAQRCRNLLSFQNGELIPDAHAFDSIERHHSLFADDRQAEIYKAVCDHLEALRGVAKKYGVPVDFLQRALISPAGDLRWLIGGGDTDDDDQNDSAEISGLNSDRSPKNRKFNY